ncbi:MAG: hypothetical protein IPM42_21670 [Saprospiraceae bacterium]|nr:hypothetical protein [Saprospiraceae bacterium]
MNNLSNLLNKKQFDKAIDECLSHVQIDFMPFHDVYRALYGFGKPIPTDLEFSETLNLIKVLLEEKNIICLEGMEKPTNKSTEELFDYLKMSFKRDMKI